ncbi:hypothetical protein [Paenibacillus anseongense]|uniref:hypothetical protein n=1 Tax=Paenibacillus anseongense TaxID=2682845 RepID=UPI002DBA62CF|nr:hypothetical protein [Paenibacillus anseongense]MEC0265145.1 hypothetical protein [Paenibacillus anseongense]
MQVLIFLVVFIAGYLLCYFTNKSNGKVVKRETDSDLKDDKFVMVKRNKPSLRNPMKTTKIEYNEYKTKNNLYAPVKPTSHLKEEVKIID